MSVDQPGDEVEPVRIRWRRHLALGTTSIAFLAVAPLIAAVGFAKPWLVGLAAVPLMALASEVAAASPPKLTMVSSVNSRRVREGDEVLVTMTITSTERGLLQIDPVSGGGISGIDASLAVDLAPNVSRTVEVECVAERWGRGTIGLDRLEWRTPLGLITWKAELRSLETVWVHPMPVRLRSRLGVTLTTARSGPHRALTRGEGVEFHSSRPFEFGDRSRDLNHRIMARTGEAWTKTRHAERSRDVIVVLDLIDDGTDPAEGASLADQSLRAAEAIVQTHLGDRDRVGVLILGSRTVSVAARDGRRQGHIIVDRLMRAEGREPSGVARRHVDLRRRIPANATVLVISPLFDRDIVEQILTLRRHGRDVVVLQVGYDMIERGRHALRPSDLHAADLRLLSAEAVRCRLRADRIAVETWSLDDPADHAIERLQLLHTALIRRWR